MAEDIELDDPYENLGAQLVKEAASKTNEVAGDGTTTATVLAEAIYKEGLRMIAAGGDPMGLSRGIRKATEAVVESIKKLSKPVDEGNKKEIAQIATIAGNNDPAIGAGLAEAKNNRIVCSSAPPGPKRLGRDSIFSPGRATDSV